MSFQFAENLKLKCRFGEAKSKRAQGEARAYLTKAMDDINPNLIELSERVPKSKEELIPDYHHVEWRDANILMVNGTITESYLKLEKKVVLNTVEHPLPLEPLAEATASPPQQPLKLTKKKETSNSEACGKIKSRNKR